MSKTFSASSCLAALLAICLATSAPSGAGAASAGHCGGLVGTYLKSKETAAKPKQAAPERKGATPQHEDVAHKRKDVAAKLSAATQVAVLEIRSAPSAPGAASPQPSRDEGVPAIEWPFEAAGQSALAMNRKLIEIAQANVTSSFDFARNLAGAKSPVEMMQLQMCYWQERISALASQAEELRALSAELVASASAPIKAHMRWTLAA
jgi:hypothetical protein